MDSLRIVLVAALTAAFALGCETMDFSLKKPLPRERRKSAVEANLDADLNATEREAADPIFEKGDEQYRRDKKAVFGIP